MQFDQLKRREFSLLAGRSSVAEGTSAYRVSMELTHSSSVLTVVALAARAEFPFRIALIELA
jgi:hypothetical protein